MATTDTKKTDDQKKTEAAAKQGPAKSDYEVLSRLHHDGEEYQPGDTVSLTAKEAKPLLGGAIKAPTSASTEE